MQNGCTECVRAVTLSAMDTPPQVLNALTSPRGRAAVASGNAGAILRVVRQELQLRQADIAARAGYSQATISRLEKGQIRDLTVTGDVADALGVPCDVFRGLAGQAILGPRVEDVERRDMLKAALAVASSAMLPAAVADADRGKRIGASAVNECWRALERLHGLEAQYGGAAVGRKLRQVTAATMIQAGGRPTTPAGATSPVTRGWRHCMWLTLAAVSTS